MCTHNYTHALTRTLREFLAQMGIREQIALGATWVHHAVPLPKTLWYLNSKL